MRVFILQILAANSLSGLQGVPGVLEMGLLACCPAHSRNTQGTYQGFEWPQDYLLPHRRGPTLFSHCEYLEAPEREGFFKE